MSARFDMSSPVPKGRLPEARRSKAPKNKSPISFFEIAIAVMMLLVVGVFGGAQAQTSTHPYYYCNTAVTWNPALTFDPLGPSTQVADIQLTRSYNCPGYKFGSLWANTNYFSDLNVSVESINVTRGSVYNLYNVGRPSGLLGSGTASHVGFQSDYGSGSNVNTIRITMTKNGVLTSGDRNLPVLLSHPSYSYYYERTYDCGNYFIYRECNYWDYSEYNYDQTRNIPINVASAMALSLAGGSTSGTMDFGNNLATDSKQSVNLRLRSNVAYKVTMDSTHNGVLKLNNSATATEQIAYSATLDNEPISESTAFKRTNPTGTGGADVTLPFEVTIGDTSNARAGFYKDVVTVTISSPP